MRLVDDPLVTPYYNEGLKQEFDDLVNRIKNIIEERQSQLPITTKELIALLQKQTRRQESMILDAIYYCIKKNQIQYLLPISDWRRYQKLSPRR